MAGSVIEKYQKRGLAVVRIITGLLLVYHGLEVFNRDIMENYLSWEQFNGTTGPFMAYLGKSAELVAGIMLTIGFFTRVAGILTAGTFLYITFIIDGGQFWYENQHPFLFALLGLILVFTGPGTWCVNNH